MHELGMVSNVLEVVIRRAEELGVRRVTEVQLLAGDDAELSDDAFLFHWDQLVAGTVAEGARVVVDHTPGGGLRLASIVVERYDEPLTQSSAGRAPAASAAAAAAATRSRGGRDPSACRGRNASG